MVGEHHEKLCSGPKAQLLTQMYAISNTKKQLSTRPPGGVTRGVLLEAVQIVSMLVSTYIQDSQHACVWTHPNHMHLRLRQISVSSC